MSQQEQQERKDVTSSTDMKCDAIAWDSWGWNGWEASTSVQGNNSTVFHCMVFPDKLYWTSLLLLLHSAQNV